MALERDNKKMRNEVRELQERADRRGRPAANNNDIELRSLQQELMDKNKVRAHAHMNVRERCYI